LEVGKVDIWKFQKDLSRTLGFWALLNMVGGLLLIFGSGLASNKRSRLTAIGMQTVGWGVINAMIALFGSRSSQRKEELLPNPQDEEVQLRESNKLKHLLLINTGLDIIYILGGVSLIWRGDRNRPQIVGHGMGIVIQAVFLFFFDLFHARKLF
jgi:hypothetical protein